MKTYRAILIIGIIEILIGGVTLFFTLGSLLMSTNTKSLNVLLFVLTAATTSSLLGVGILKFKNIAYRLLVFFAAVVALSKMLIFLDVIRLNGSLETNIPPCFKNGVSMFYHIFLLYYLKKPKIKQIFYK
ncbi:MAG: hypothetical protein KAR05_11165 [Candidatus Omnitrophica bacterium]|nr:hypothetical protein [Candidatus Omnitrophota bacterium]